MENFDMDTLTDAIEGRTADEFMAGLIDKLGMETVAVINEAYGRIALLSLDRSPTLDEMVASVKAAQWAAFSTGWDMRGVVDAQG